MITIVGTTGTWAADYGLRLAARWYGAKLVFFAINERGGIKCIR